MEEHGAMRPSLAPTMRCCATVPQLCYDVGLSCMVRDAWLRPILAPGHAWRRHSVSVVCDVGLPCTPRDASVLAKMVFVRLVVFISLFAICAVARAFRGDVLSNHEFHSEAEFKAVCWKRCKVFLIP